ncbi:hypothetical protein BSLG_009244 [Batrachochytrium salamandrivorans]|nr:hypothetical protein BSLG_009244 [Batrachochytrium salamandrivorans]
MRFTISQASAYAQRHSYGHLDFITRRILTTSSTRATPQLRQLPTPIPRGKPTAISRGLGVILALYGIGLVAIWGTVDEKQTETKNTHKEQLKHYADQRKHLQQQQE